MNPGVVVVGSVVQNMISALTSTTRREYIHIGSASASMLPTVVEAAPKSCLQVLWDSEF
jgi:hypothetical protein